MLLVLTGEAEEPYMADNIDPAFLSEYGGGFDVLYEPANMSTHNHASITLLQQRPRPRPNHHEPLQAAVETTVESREGADCDIRGGDVRGHEGGGEGTIRDGVGPIALRPTFTVVACGVAYARMAFNLMASAAVMSVGKEYDQHEIKFIIFVDGTMALSKVKLKI